MQTTFFWYDVMNADLPRYCADDKCINEGPFIVPCYAEPKLKDLIPQCPLYDLLHFSNGPLKVIQKSAVRCGDG